MDRDVSPIDTDPLQAMHDEDLSRGEDVSESDVADFTMRSLRYITEDTNFLDQPDSLGLSESTICSSCVESDDSGRCDSDPDSFQPRPKRRRTQRGVESRQKGKSVVKAALQDVASPKTTKKSMITPTQHAQIRQLMNQKICAFESYTFYKDTHASVGDKTSSRHRSYTWLLGVCSRHIDTDVACLDKYVRRFEMAFIIDEDELCTRAKWQKRAFQRRYLC